MQKKIVDLIEDAIYSLKAFPNRGAIRKEGIFNNSNYRQLFVKNHTIIYKVVEDKSEVHIVAIRYSASDF